MKVIFHKDIDYKVIHYNDKGEPRLFASKYGDTCRHKLKLTVTEDWKGKKTIKISNTIAFDIKSWGVGSVMSFTEEAYAVLKGLIKLYEETKR